MDQAPRMMMELRPFLVWSSTPEFVLAHHASKELLSGWGRGPAGRPYEWTTFWHAKPLKLNNECNWFDII